tara:strand:- start:522 stop:1463 length:942 start_codon:yes stop_codon:yes gene_type:complete
MYRVYNLIVSNLLIILFIFKRFIKKEKYLNFEVIIFSYNRPLQLDSLLDSLIKKFDKNIKVNILYKYDKLKICNSYKKLIENHRNNKNINFTKENLSFKKSIIDLTKKISKNQKNTNILFFVDDQILFREINLKSLIRLTKYSAISTLRIGLNTKWSFNLNKKQSLDCYKYKEYEGSLIWSPQFKNDEISYVFSFDGSTIPLDLFKKFSKYLIFKGPNSLETSMNYGSIVYKLFKQKISCFKKQSAVNIVLSMVQTETRNRGEFIDINKLTELFENNWKLKLDYNKIKLFNSPHIDYGYYLEKKNQKRFINNI